MTTTRRSPISVQAPGAGASANTLRSTASVGSSQRIAARLLVEERRERRAGRVLRLARDVFAGREATDRLAKQPEARPI